MAARLMRRILVDSAQATVDETVIVLKVAPDTVMRDLRLARAWLARELPLEPRDDA